LDVKDTRGVPDSENSQQFHQLMADAMGLSFFKYGKVADAYPEKVDAIKSLKARLEKYEQTGDRRLLPDVSNFAMIEFMHPKHPDAHFPEHDTDATGRVWNSGSQSEQANTAGQENLRRGGSHLRTDGGFYKREGD